MLPTALMAAHSHRMQSSSLLIPTARIQTVTLMFIPDCRVNTVVHGWGLQASQSCIRSIPCRQWYGCKQLSQRDRQQHKCGKLAVPGKCSYTTKSTLKYSTRWLRLCRT
jgi:hypothetical protein